MEFPKFDGNPLKWKEFHDAFNSTIHNNNNLSNIDKFNYLKANLIGSAHASIQGLELVEGNYSIALDILTERFGK